LGYLEFILLSDALGVSSLVDSMNNAKPPGATEATVLGPFFTTDALDCQSASSRLRLMFCFLNFLPSLIFFS
jgi:hypothetical protein